MNCREQMGRIDSPRINLCTLSYTVVYTGVCLGVCIQCIYIQQAAGKVTVKTNESPLLDLAHTTLPNRQSVVPRMVTSISDGCCTHTATKQKDGLF